MPFDFTTRRSICPTEAGGGGSSILTDVTIPPSVVSQTIYPQEGFDGFNKVVVPAVPLESIAINPSTLSQSFVPSGENLGFNTITVNPVTANIDPNITASNIVNGCNILGVVGVAEASAPKEVARYVVDENGVATISDKNITGMFDDITKVKTYALYNAFSNTNVYGTVSFPNCVEVGINSMGYAFYNTKISDISFPNLTSSVAGLRYAFANCNINNVDFHSVVCVIAGGYEGAFSNSVINFVNFSSLVDASTGFPSAFRNSSINNVDFSKVRYTDLGCFSYSFYNSKGLTSISFPNLTNAGGRAFNSAFANSKLISFDAQNITTVLDDGFSGAFSNAIDFTYFNVSENMTISGNNAFTGAFRGSNLTSFKLSPTLGNYANCFKDAFNNCSNLISVNLSAQSVYNIGGSSFFMNACRNCKNLVSVDLSSVSSVFPSLTDQGFANAFRSDVNLTTVNVYSLSLPNVGTNAFRNTFYECTNLTTMDWTGIETLCMGNMCFDNAYAFSGIQNLSFSGLWANLWSWSSNTSRPLKNMLANVDGCTVHFPVSAEDAFRNHVDFQIGFGGTNTTVLFDLPKIKQIIGVEGFYNITSNGEMGGETTAVNASSNSANAWKGFTLSSSDGWKPLAGDVGPYYYTIYQPLGIKMKKAQLTTAYGINGVSTSPVMINVCVSNDGQDWQEANATFSRTVYVSEAASHSDTEFLKPGYFKYYRFCFNSYENDSSYLPIINFIDINGTFKTL